MLLLPESKHPLALFALWLVHHTCGFYIQCFVSSVYNRWSIKAMLQPFFNKTLHILPYIVRSQIYCVILMQLIFKVSRADRPGCLWKEWWESCSTHRAREQADVEGQMYGSSQPQEEWSSRHHPHIGRGEMKKVCRMLLNLFLWWRNGPRSSHKALVKWDVKLGDRYWGLPTISVPHNKATGV